MPTDVIVYEDAKWRDFLPLVYVRATFQLICGMDSLISKVRRHIEARQDLSTPRLWCRSTIAPVASEQTELESNQPASGPTLLVNGRALWSRLPEVEPGDRSWVGVVGPDDKITCVYADAELAPQLSYTLLGDAARSAELLATLPKRDVGAIATMMEWPWQLVHANANALITDWRHRSDQAGVFGDVADGSYVLGSAVRIGKGSRIKPCAVIDAEEGPVWIGDNVRIMPHTTVIGPAYIGDGSLIQPGATVHEGTTIGPTCKVGGEIDASIIQGYSNKQHDGFLGHAYLGSWINIAADCINSDLKNTYGPVRVPINGYEVESGEMFVGVMIGDHSKIGINVSIPTGAVIGFCSSVFASRGPKWAPSFTWLDGVTIERYDELRGLEVARKVMARRSKTMTAAEQQAFLASHEAALRIERQPERDV